MCTYDATTRDEVIKSRTVQNRVYQAKSNKVVKATITIVSKVLPKAVNNIAKVEQKPTSSNSNKKIIKAGNSNKNQHRGDHEINQN